MTKALTLLASPRPYAANGFILSSPQPVEFVDEIFCGIGKSIEVLNLSGKKIISGLHTFLLRDKNDIRYAKSIAKEKVQAPHPAMSWDDTLGNLKALDQWRDRVNYKLPQDE